MEGRTWIAAPLSFRHSPVRIPALLSVRSMPIASAAPRICDLPPFISLGFGGPFTSI